MVGIARRGPSSDPVIVWRGVNSETLTTRGGLLVATRGFGQDLMSSDLRALNRATHTSAPIVGTTVPNMIVLVLVLLVVAEVVLPMIM